MRKLEFKPLQNARYGWYCSRQSLAIFDARPANFISIQDSPVPFDLIPVCIDGGF
jgi:hypothetical protein